MKGNIEQKYKLVVKSHLHNEDVFEKWFDSIEECIEFGEGLVNCRQRDGLLEYVDIYTQAYLFTNAGPYKSERRYYFYNCGSEEFGIMLHEGDYDE